MLFRSALAANQAVGSFGRLYLGGEEQDIIAGADGALTAMERVAGRENPLAKRQE